MEKPDNRYLAFVRVDSALSITFGGESDCGCLGINQFNKFERVVFVGKSNNEYLAFVRFDTTSKIGFVEESD